jgi:vacuolar-type H+-ATPase subunit F/Vma7
MTPLVVGRREDVAGFALAGIEGVVCATREEAHQAIARAGEGTLVIVSAEFAREAPRGPLVVALPSRS